MPRLGEDTESPAAHAQINVVVAASLATSNKTSTFTSSGLVNG